MKKTLLYFFSILFVGTFFISCSEEEKIEPVKVDGYQTYVQNKTDLTINVPKGWPQSEQLEYNRLIVYSDEQGKTSFKNVNNPEKNTNEHIPAAKVEVWTKIMDSTNDFDHFFDISEPKII